MFLLVRFSVFAVIVCFLHLSNALVSDFNSTSTTVTDISNKTSLGTSPTTSDNPEINKCNDGTAKCPEDSTLCVPTDNDYYCDCLEGFSLKKGETKFENKDACIENIIIENPCELSPDICPKDSTTCVVKDGGAYYCKCLPNFKLKDGNITEEENKESCVENIIIENPCELMWNICPKDSTTCVVKDGGAYYCKCLPNFKLKDDHVKEEENKESCVEITKCNDGTAKCPQDSTLCVPTDNDYYCDCLEGFTLKKGETKFENKDACIENIIIENPCELSPDICPKDSTTCVVKDGGAYYCKCLPNFKLKDDHVKEEENKESCVEDKDCEKNHCKNGGTCVKTNGGERCICPYPYGGNICEESYWCSEGVGKAQCPEGKCRFDFTSKIGHCECPKDQYFNYDKKQCEVIDICPLMPQKCSGSFEECKNGDCECMENFKRNNKKECIPNFCDSKPFPCGENELCEDVLDDPGRVRCTCKEDYIFDGKTCQKGNKCSLPGALGCQHICNPEKGICDCHPGFKLQPDKKSCSLADASNKCQKDCGLGTCMKAKEGEVCICPGTHISNGNTCVDKCTAKALPAGLCPNNECIQDGTIGFKCKCGGKLTYDANGVTCKKKLMCYEDKGIQTCNRLNALCVEDFDSENGYECKCREGQDFDKTVQCKNKCELDIYKDKCGKLLAVCDMEYDAPVCKCPPMLTFGPDGRCTEIEKTSYTGILPIAKQHYDTPFASASGNGLSTDTVNYALLKQDVRESMRFLHGMNYKYADVISCESKPLAFNCLVEVQFNSEPRDQVQIIGDPNMCIGSATNTCLIPPRLLLIKSEILPEMFSATDPCMKEVKDTNCGTGSECTSSEDGSKNFECKCGKGFEPFGTFQPLSDKRTSVQKCQDIDECLDFKACPNRTRCLNTVGDYECVCQNGYRPISSTSTIKKTGCIEMCDSKVCIHGHCEASDGVFICKCDEGYTGFKCDKELLSEANQHGMKIALILLAAIVVPLALMTVFLVHAYRQLRRKSNKSNYFDDNSPILGMQPIRGSTSESNNG